MWSNGVMQQKPAGALAPDALAGSIWRCWSSAPDAVADPRDLQADDVGWMPTTVPGTVAGTLRTAGEWTSGDDDHERLDGQDWWFRCRFDGPDGTPEGPWWLVLDGLATLADVWLNGAHLLHSENMWVAHRVGLDRLEPHNELVLRFAALEPRLAERRPRPRWRSVLLRTQNLRWYRTALLGRMLGSSSGAVVGPWRPIRLHRAGGGVSVVHRRLVARCDGKDGVVEVRLELEGVVEGTEVDVRVGSHLRSAVVTGAGAVGVVETSVRVPDVDRWWPHTHGDQPRYPVVLVAGGTEHDLGAVGFRTVDVDRDGGAFTLSLNGVPLFCRGACWVPPDIVTLGAGVGAVRASLRRVVEAGMNMVRITGETSYEGPDFWDACDELGILVWQDCMLAGFDPPEDPQFLESLDTELRQELGALQGRPALAVVCGSSDILQQGAMFGLSADRLETPLLEETIPAGVDEVLPGAVYVPSSPCGGALPFYPSEGVAAYFGVGAYLQPLSDARTAGVRFAAECLSFSIPPEASSVEQWFGGSAVAGHHPDWKHGVPRDPGASWDFEDVRDDYVRQIFGIDSLRTRYVDPDRSLDYGRAAVAHLMSTVMGEWRCRQSSCAGGLVLGWQDTVPGAGRGLLDADGSPKAPWFALRRVLAPVALVVTDEGLAGLRIHVINDQPSPCRGTLHLSLFDPAGFEVETVTGDVDVPGRSQRAWSAVSFLDGFRDLTDAYRFGPPAYDAVRVALDMDGVVTETVHLPTGSGRPVEADLGLEARAALDGDRWSVTIGTRRLAQWVALDVVGYTPDDSWFHLAPGCERTVSLRPRGVDAPPKGRVRALNGLHSVPIVIA